MEPDMWKKMWKTEIKCICHVMWNVRNVIFENCVSNSNTFLSCFYFLFDVELYIKNQKYQNHCSFSCTRVCLPLFAWPKFYASKMAVDTVAARNWKWTLAPSGTFILMCACMMWHSSRIAVRWQKMKEKSINLRIKLIHADVWHRNRD